MRASPAPGFAGVSRGSAPRGCSCPQAAVAGGGSKSAPAAAGSPTQTPVLAPAWNAAAQAALVWRFEEAQNVRCGINQRDGAACTVRVEAGIQERIALRVQLPVEALGVTRLDVDRRTGGAVAVMRRKVKDEIVAGHLDVDRSISFAFPPIDLAAQVLAVEPEVASTSNMRRMAMTCLKVGVMPAFHQLAPVPRLPFTRKAATPSSRPLEAWTGVPSDFRRDLPCDCHRYVGRRRDSPPSRGERYPAPASGIAAAIGAGFFPAARAEEGGDLGLRDARAETEAG